MGSDQMIVMASEGFEGLTGHSIDRIVGSNCVGIFSRYSKFLFHQICAEVSSRTWYFQECHLQNSQGLHNGNFLRFSIKLPLLSLYSKGLPAQELLLNYKEDGQPIWVLLRIEPLRDHTGQLRYLLGHQFSREFQRVLQDVLLTRIAC